MEFTGENVIRCGVRTKKCRACGRRYTKDERALESCPDCNEPRACTVPVPSVGARCQVHGRKSQLALGTASPAYKNGLYSRNLPTRLAAMYAESMADPELLAMRQGIALLEARLYDLLSRTDVGGGEAQIKAVSSKYDELAKARDEVDFALGIQNADRLATALDKLRNAVTALGNTIGEARQDYAIWHDVMDVLEQQRRLKDSERRRMVEAQQTIDAERALLMIGAYEAIVRRHVKNRTTLAAIATDVRTTFGL